MSGVTLTAPDGLHVVMSAKAFKALKAWPDLDVDRLTSVNGEVHACRRSNGLAHALSVRALVELVAAPAATKRPQERKDVEENPAQLEAVPVAPAASQTPAPAFGFALPDHVPREITGPRQVQHCHRTRTVYVPILDMPEYAVIDMADYYGLRDSGMTLRCLAAERKARRPEHVLAGRAGTTTKDIHLAERLCPGNGPVIYVDGNPGNLMPSNLRRES
jgi:hypothetical protein